ncbi:MAG: DUF3187 family protein [Campylobacterota bacterium]
MMKSLLFVASLLMAVSLCAYTDSDMDGVDDSIDQCPNTPLTDLADISGCTKGSLASPHHYDIIVGLNYSDSDYRSLNAMDTLATSFQVDYYYRQLSIQASTSFFTTDGGRYSDSGLYDSFLGASYRLDRSDNLSISLSAGLILPTYHTELNNNNMDYTASMNLSYTLENINIFGGYTFTLINDDNVDEITYQNTNTLSVGVGSYVDNKLYMSASYSVGDSIYKGLADIKTATVHGYYSIDKDRFATVSYAHGLSDTASDNYFSVRLGFLF